MGTIGGKDGRSLSRQRHQALRPGDASVAKRGNQWWMYLAGKARDVDGIQASEDWEHGSVYEPNLVYAEGQWKMWYVAGSNQDDYIVQAYAESPDGRDNWTRHKIVFPPEEKVFDFCIIKAREDYEVVFSPVWPGKTPPGVRACGGAI